MTLTEFYKLTPRQQVIRRSIHAYYLALCDNSERKMTKDELNREWAELEGCEEVNGALNWDGRSRINFDPLGQGTVWKFPDGSLDNDIPDFTEPNRFFAEVVPRMNELELTPRLCQYSKSNWCCEWNRITNDECIASSADGTVGEAGLEAAIKARKELGK